MNLITFHFAGGNRFSFNALKKLMPPSINCVGTEFPGRLNQKELTTNIYEIVECVYQDVIKFIDQPYAFFGHSMGTTISYLITKKIRENNLRPPMHLFVGGRMGPSFPFLKDGFHKLHKTHFLDAVKALDGIPEEIYKSAAAMEYFEPYLRADFAAIEGYVYEHTAPFDVPISVFYGSNEGVDARILEASWQKETTIPIKVYFFPGGHFFINHQWDKIADIIKNQLKVSTVGHKQS